LSGLFEDGIGDAEFAYVVEQSGATEDFDALFGEPESLPDCDGGIGDAVRMLVGKGSFGVNNIGESETDVIDVLLSRREAAVLRFLSHHFGDQLLGFEPRP